MVTARWNSDNRLPRLTLPARVAQEITEMIRCGQLRVGARLPSQDLLASQLGVSRATLREGLSLLMNQGVVEVRHGSGTFVLRTPVVPFIPRGHPVPDTEGSNWERLASARTFLEYAMAGEAAGKASAADLEALSTLLQDMKRCWKVGDRAGLTAYAQQFHARMVEISGNPVLSRLLDEIKETQQRELAGDLKICSISFQHDIEYYSALYSAIRDDDTSSLWREGEVADAETVTVGVCLESESARREVWSRVLGRR